MRKQTQYFTLTLVISALVGIILPFAIPLKPIDLKRFFYIMVMGFTLVWVVSSIILFAYVFLSEGRRRRNESKARREGDPFSLHSTKELEALWKITVGRHKDPGMGNPDWN